MNKSLSAAEARLRKIEKHYKPGPEDKPIVYRLIDRDGSVFWEFTIPPRSQWKYK